MVSLGCPKALVDSERILTRLRADGYAMSPDYAGADVVLMEKFGPEGPLDTLYLCNYEHECSVTITLV